MEIQEVDLLNTNKGYDIYYEGGEESIYNKRFGKDKLILNEKMIIKDAFAKVIKKLKYKKISGQKLIRVLDYGCGDGRLLSFLEDIAKKYQKWNIDFHIYAYDINLLGLNEYGRRIKFQNYEKFNTENKCDNLLSSFYKNNVKINLIHGKYEDRLSDIDLFSNIKFNINLCMFSVLSHVAKREDRIDILRNFNKFAADGGISVLTAPTRNMFLEEYNTYKYLRELTDKLYRNNIEIESLYKIKEFLDITKNNGDLLYYRENNNKFLLNFCRVFTCEEFIEEIRLAKLKNTKISGLSLLYIPILTTKNFITKLIDFLISKVISINFFSYKLINDFANQIISITYHE